MNWMNEVFYLLFLTSVTGSIVYLAWMLLARGMEKAKKLRFIFPMLLMVVPFFCLPLLYLQIKMSGSFGVDEGASSGLLFIRTPLIYKMQCAVGMIWLAGAALNLLNYFIRAFMLRRLLRMSCYTVEARILELSEEIKKELRIRRRVTVVWSYGVPSPTVLGAFSKTVLLPMCDYTEDEIKVILYHELVHIKQNIIGFKNLGVLVKLVHWMNPFAYLLMRSLDEWGETACDLMVRYSTRCGLSMREYFAFVLKEIEREEVCPPYAVTQFGKRKGIKERIMKVKDYKREKDLRLVGGVLTVCLFLGCCTTTTFAAGTSFEEAYDTVYGETMQSIDETNVCLAAELEEYEKPFDADAENIVEMELDDRARGAFTLSWNIPANTFYKTAKTYYAKNGGTISINLAFNPQGNKVWAGIITPDGFCHYVESNGENVTHSFDLTRSGDYYIFIENKSGNEINATGSFTY